MIELTKDEYWWIMGMIKDNLFMINSMDENPYNDEIREIKISNSRRPGAFRIIVRALLAIKASGGLPLIAKYSPEYYVLFDIGRAATGFSNVNADALNKWFDSLGVKVDWCNVDIG